MNFKNTLRVEIIHNLQGIDNKDELSEQITKNIVSMPLWEKSSKLFLYMSFKDEVITESLINTAEKEGKKIYAPRIKGRRMSFHRIDNICRSELIKNRYGILEPPVG